MSWTRRLVAACAATALTAACGVPTGPESFDPIEGADVGNRLDEPATTTTTTTTISPTTTPPTTTRPDQPEITSTTADPEPPTESVDIFFLSRGELRPQPTEVLAPKTANDLILLLEAGPVSDLLDNEIQPDLIETTSEDSGILTIELNDGVFDEIPVRDQRDAIAQMVLTFLSNLTGVGQAVFTIDDQRQTVPIDLGRVSDEPVSLDDYETMVVGADPEDTSTTTDVATTEP